MRRFVAMGVAAIALVFGGSLVLLVRLDEAEPAKAPVAIRQPPAPAVTPAPAVDPDQLAPPPPKVAPEVIAQQLASPPQDPAPAPPPPPPLPPSGAPPAPVYVRQELPALQKRIASRCGTLTLRLGDQLRKEGRNPEGHAVLLLDIEPMEGSVKVWDVRLQSPGNTRPSLVACAQNTLRGHTFDVSALRPGARMKVQVVVGVE